MPELPDLQAFAGNLNKALSGKVVETVSVVNAKKLNVSEAELQESLQKQELIKVERIGKELHFYFKNGNVLGLHLMLNGELFVAVADEKRKHTIVKLVFDDKTVFSMNDYQGFAAPTLNPADSNAPDALSEKIDFEFLKKALKTKSSVKKVLLDQHVMRGIGNAYADEILWEAKINPLSISNKIPDDKIKDLAKAIKVVLQNAIKHITKTHPDIITGEVRDFLKVHNHKNKQSPTGAAIQTVMVNSRKSYFTDEQELYN